MGCSYTNLMQMLLLLIICSNTAADEGSSQAAEGNPRAAFWQPSQSAPDLESGWLTNALQQRFPRLGKQIDA